MFDFLADILDSIKYFFTYIVDFLTSGIFDLLIDFALYLKDLLFLLWLKIAVYSVENATAFISSFTSNIDLTSSIESGWLSLPLEIREFLAFFRIPEILTMIFSAFVVRFFFKRFVS